MTGKLFSLPRVALVLVAKQPVAGRVKTRLTPAFSAPAAAAIYETFLSHVRSTCEQLSAALGTIDLVLLYDPPESADTWNLWTQWCRIPQSAGDLGQRLESGLKKINGEALTGCIFIGADAPELTYDHLAWAVDQVRASRYAMIPAYDGGYVLIGIPDGRAPLFQGISWSTPHVARQTRRAAGRQGVVISERPALHDIDTPEDLADLLQRLGTCQCAAASALRRQLAHAAGVS